MLWNLQFYQDTFIINCHIHIKCNHLEAFVHPLAWLRLARRSQAEGAVLEGDAEAQLTQKT